MHINIFWCDILWMTSRLFVKHLFKIGYVLIDFLVCLLYQ